MLTLGPHELIVGLGSNAEHALSMLRRARKALRAHPAFRLVTTSPIYESDALLPPHAPASWNRPYLNAACRLQLDTDLSAAQIVAHLKELERALGRVEAPRWAPREIDLDLLAWGKTDVSTPEVNVPHAGLLNRPFALLPALDCAESSYSTPEILCWRYSHSEAVPQRTHLTGASWSELVGILNLTPDSFSDGGKVASVAQVEDAITEMIKAGASIIDVGAESTRPGATPLTSEQEILRLAPVLEVILQLKEKQGLRISLDSRHAATAAWALERGLPDWLNDVQGFAHPEMRLIAKHSDCKIVVMHELGIPPRSDRTLPTLQDPVIQVLEWARDKIRSLTEAGIEPGRIVMDPGIGFGKTASQNLALLERSEIFHQLKTEILIGHSRKRFLDPDLRVPAGERDLETAILTSRMAKAGIDYLRVHAPAIQARALRLGARLSS